MMELRGDEVGEDLPHALAVSVRRRLREAPQVQEAQRGAAALRERLHGARGDVQVPEEAQPMQASEELGSKIYTPS